MTSPDRRYFVFTLHKAASLGVHEVLRRIARKEGWPFYSPNLKTPNLVEPGKNGDANFLKQLDGKTGLVGPVRRPVALTPEAVADDRFILHLRDPRDVLVSMFFSWSYSHPGVNEEWRATLRERGVDYFVLKETPELMERYKLYIDDYLSVQTTTLLRYEDFVLNRLLWLEELLGALNIENGVKRYRRLANDNPAEKIRNEDKMRHIRKALPGDYKDKLQPETIAALNDRWSGILSALDY